MVTKIEASIRCTCCNNLIPVWTFSRPVYRGFFIDHTCVGAKIYGTEASGIFEMVLRPVSREENGRDTIPAMIKGPVKNKTGEDHRCMLQDECPSAYHTNGTTDFAVASYETIIPGLLGVPDILKKS